jgi:hypothetical protein
MKKALFFLLLLLSGIIHSGCVEFLAMGTYTGVSEIFKYNSRNVAERTYTGNLDAVTSASEKALEEMQIYVEGKDPHECTADIRAAAGDVNIQIHLESLTPKTTRVTVEAFKDRFHKDKATAQEIVSQIGLALAAQRAFAARSRVYEVQPGDNPTKIAESHNMPLTKLLSVNRLTMESLIFPGQQLYVE